jgi:hypothetical protein
MTVFLVPQATTVQAHKIPTPQGNAKRVTTAQVAAQRPPNIVPSQVITHSRAPQCRFCARQALTAPQLMQLLANHAILERAALTSECRLVYPAHRATIAQAARLTNLLARLEVTTLMSLKQVQTLAEIVTVANIAIKKDLSLYQEIAPLDSIAIGLHQISIPMSRSRAWPVLLSGLRLLTLMVYVQLATIVHREQRIRLLAQLVTI